MRVDVCQVEKIFLLKMKNFPGKVLVIRKLVVPLHPLSGKPVSVNKKEFFESLT